MKQQTFVSMDKPVYCARPDQYKITVDSLIRIYCFSNRLTSRVYFKAELAHNLASALSLRAPMNCWDVDRMLGQCCRRWPSIRSTLNQHSSDTLYGPCAVQPNLSTCGSETQLEVGGNLNFQCSVTCLVYALGHFV